MKTSTFVLVALSCLTVESAFAGQSFDYLDYSIQGSSCTSITRQASTGAPIVAPGYSQYGVNAFETAIDVVCPLALPPIWYSIAWLKIGGYNRSFNDWLTCSLMETKPDGTWILPVVTSAIKLNGQPWQTSSSSSGGFSKDSVRFLTCHIPAQTWAGQSHLTVIYLRLSYDASVKPTNEFAN